MPSAITVHNETVKELEQLCQDFKAQVKPLLDEDRKTCHIQHSLPMPEGEDALEEMQEASQSTFDDDGRSQEEGEGYSVDPLTGWRRRPLSPYEIERRNDQLLANYERRLRNSVGNQAPLPIKDKRQNILDLIDNNRVVVLSGDTGCGKSTQMPQFLLDHFAQQRRGSECNIIVTQPRRLAALALAQTVARDRGETVMITFSLPAGFWLLLNIPNDFAGRTEHRLSGPFEFGHAEGAWWLRPVLFNRNPAASTASLPRLGWHIALDY